MLLVLRKLPRDRIRRVVRSTEGDSNTVPEQDVDLVTLQERLAQEARNVILMDQEVRELQQQVRETRQQVREMHQQVRETRKSLK